ncbi:MAG TPA: tetratricopeptide repeat protein [Acidobacteriaceae bacterium]|jgi:tetratricopeptide (TPR) repeat protein|nr:tetratricopeptide repeat protein [Acidobacteriaceae bacterium]
MPHAGTVVAPLFLLLALVPPAAPQALDALPGHVAPAQLTPEARGDLAMIRQEYVTAIDFYRKSPQDSPDVWNKLGMAFHHLFAIDEAKRAYERALHLRPAYPEALNNLGAVYFAQKNYPKAVRCYRKALALNPNSATMYCNLGTAWFAEERYEDGLGAYQKAFALDPRVFNESSSLLVNEPLPASRRAQEDYSIARIFAQSGKNAKALDFLRRALNEGFGDRQKLYADQTLTALRATPEFAHLMTEEQLR